MMIDTRENERPTLRLAAVLLAAVLLTLGAACGGGETADAPVGDAPAGDAPAAQPSADADLEPGNAAVAELGDGSATVSGTISYAGTVPSLRPVTMDADPQCAGKHQGPVPNQVLWLGDGNTMGNVFVKVKSGLAEKQWPAPAEPAVIDQEGCLYHPHVVGMLAGQSLVFLNSDELLHNVHGLPEENRDFNLGMPATVTRSNVTLERPEPVFPVKCDIHPWMQAYVAVMSHPYFDVTGEDGRFEIRNLPAGTYEIEAWHERLGTQTATVTVEDGGSATSDLTFSTPQS
jgi:plastocyanin